MFVFRRKEVKNYAGKSKAPGAKFTPPPTHNEKGFTLVELMVVVIILGVLAGIAVPRYLAKTDDAKISATLSTLQAVQGAMNNYYVGDLGNGKFPYGADEAAIETELEKALNAAGLTWAGMKDGYGKSLKYGVDGASGTKFILYSQGKDDALNGGNDIVCTDKQQPLSGKNVGTDYTAAGKPYSGVVEATS
jgi:type II secretion system protein G